MASRQSDQGLVRSLATANPSKIVPCFGYHPWFSHCIAIDQSISKEEHYKRLLLGSQKGDKSEYQETFTSLLSNLPTPRPLDEVLNEMRQNLSDFPTAMVGEIGLDRSFHIPYDYHTTPRELTPFTVPFDHQLAIVEAQMDLAVELGRNVSLHSVKSQQATVDLLDRLNKKHGDSLYRISIDMHSCGFSTETWNIIEKKHSNVFLSLSMVINEKHPGYKALIAACSDDRILVESDYNDIRMSTSQTWGMLEHVAEIKKWEIETTWVDFLDEENWGAVRRLEQNWFKFRGGNHTPPTSKKSTKRRKKVEQYRSPSPSDPVITANERK
ncbi:Metallo-dependent hydrolase [Macrolepiota fuliginosa MF-IS2]|uniref:Metallo-dependent hydrolase n=1 Tax=Macrolepiota fuliginosa MF-IS2 TaxID=1400762 RepID=A0A9P6C6Y3_9AGAR|nr:Metallo-dependent hydrolase [Macrolepiota fuliginosa MF-IS2]